MTKRENPKRKREHSPSITENVGKSPNSRSFNLTTRVHVQCIKYCIYIEEKRENESREEEHDRGRGDHNQESHVTQVSRTRRSHYSKVLPRVVKTKMRVSHFHVMGHLNAGVSFASSNKRESKRETKIMR